MNRRGERITVAVRAVTPRDLPGLLRMSHQGLSLDAPDTLLLAYTPLRGLAQTRWLPFRRQSVRTYVAHCPQAPCAFVQVRDRAAPYKWDILYLGALARGLAALESGRGELWTALLDYATVAAGRRGVHRLYAKLPRDATTVAAEAFRAAGYARYGEETLYVLHGGTPVATPPGDDDAVALRLQSAADTWALHQLYTWTTPKPVQYAEAYTSYRWELPKWRWGRRGPREWGLLVNQGQELVAYCRVRRFGKRSRLEVLFQPRARAALGPALGAVLRWLTPAAGEQIYCAVQEHQQELGSLLTTYGFVPLGTQELLVRYTTVPVLARTGEPRPARERIQVGVPVHP